MKEEVVSISDTRLKVTQRFDSGELAAERERIVATFCREGNVAGFRKGKLPKNVVESKFKDSIAQQLRSAVTRKAIDATVENRQDWLITAIVDVENEDFSDGATCSVTIDFIPDFEVPDYKNISIAAINVSVSEDEIESELRDVFRRYAKYDLVDRASQKGDFVKFSYVGKFDTGELVADIESIPEAYASQNNAWEEVRVETFLEVRALADALLGAVAGEQKEVQQVFESDFKIPELAGRTVNYDLNVAEVRACVLPEITEELLKPYGVKTKEELCEKIKAVLLNNKTSQARFNQREELVTKLADAAKISIPEQAVDREAMRLVTEFANKQVRKGAKPEEVQTNLQGFQEKLKPVSLKRLKVGAILDKISKIENVTIEAKDVENMIWQDIQNNGLDVNKYVAELKRDEGKLADVRKRARRGKTLDMLMIKACEDLKPSSPEETVPAKETR